MAVMCTHCTAMFSSHERDGEAAWPASDVDEDRRRPGGAEDPEAPARRPQVDGDHGAGADSEGDAEGEQVAAPRRITNRGSRLGAPTSTVSAQTMAGETDAPASDERSAAAT